MPRARVFRDFYGGLSSVGEEFDESADIAKEEQIEAADYLAAYGSGGEQPSFLSNIWSSITSALGSDTVKALAPAIGAAIAGQVSAKTGGAVKVSPAAPAGAAKKPVAVAAQPAGALPTWVMPVGIAAAVGVGAILFFQLTKKKK
jgi:hypothetical protein